MSKNTEKKPAELSDTDLEAAVGGGFTGGVYVATGDVNGDGASAHELAHVVQGGSTKNSTGGSRNG